MQQYFCNEELKINSDYVFTKEQSHHAGDVLHLNKETVRLVYQGRGYFAETFYDNHVMKAHVYAEDPEDNELGLHICLAMALIRREKFELVLQKACEIGVDEIVPLITERCIMQVKKDKEEKLMQRWNAILLEAAEQCKRSRVPVLHVPDKIKNIDKYASELNLVPYEKASDTSEFISSLYNGEKSATAVIGPEGGFSESEIAFLKEKGYHVVTLGKRILRAETAAVYTCSILSEAGERNALR